MREMMKIPARAAIRGDVEALADVLVEGELEGSVRADSVVIAHGGFVSGEIVARRVRIEGRLLGRASADQLLIAGPEALVDGDLAAAEFQIDPEAAITGELITLSEPKRREAPPTTKGRGSSSGGRRPIPEPRMPVMLRASGERRTIPA